MRAARRLLERTRRVVLAGLMLERVYTTPASGLAIGVFFLVWTMAAARAATRSALQVVGGREHQVRALEVVVFGLQMRRRDGLVRWVAFHASILSQRTREWRP